MIKMTPKIVYLLALSICLASCYPTRSTLQVERDELSGIDITWLADCSPDLSKPLSLQEIIHIALSRNLELFVKEQEELIQEDQATRIRYALLPELNYGFSDTNRSQNTASKSQPLNPPPNSSPPLYQIGSPRHEQTWNLGLVWNVLDFGVTYFRARQEQNRATIQQFEYERIQNGIVLRAVTSYWKAVASVKSLRRSEILLPEMNGQTKRLDQEVKDRVYLSKDQALSKVVYFLQREIEVRGFNDRNDSSDPTQGYEKEYESALLDLASLMQLPPGAKFDVLIPDDDLPYEVELPPANDLFNLALMNRPELFEKDLDFKISADDVNIAMIQQFPGLQLFNIDNYDRNPFLLHKNWYQAGVKVAWNLLEFPQHLMQHKVGVESEERDMRNRLLISQGVITQVSLAYLLYDQNRDQYLLAKKVAEASNAVAELSDAESKVGKKSKLEALQARVDAALALNNQIKIYAELQANLEQLNNAIGIPLYFSTFKTVESDDENMDSSF